MAKADRIEQLAQELCFNALTKNQREAKRSELVLLLYKENLDTVHFMEAFNSCLAKYGAECEKAGQRISFEKLLESYNHVKNLGSEAEKIQENNFEKSRYIGEKCRELFVDYDLDFNRSYKRYPNKDKIIASLRKQVENDSLYEELRQRVENIFEWPGLESVDRILESDEGESSSQDGYGDSEKAEYEERSQNLLTDIIEMSYSMTEKMPTLYRLDRCWWTGNMYTIYLRMIPLILQELAEMGYIDYYEQRRILDKLLDILDKSVFAGYLDNQPDTVRKNLKKLEKFHIQALERVTRRNAIGQ